MYATKRTVLNQLLSDTHAGEWDTTKVLEKVQANEFQLLCFSVKIHVGKQNATPRVVAYYKRKYRCEW
jgi:hypothetical protein